VFTALADPSRRQVIGVLAARGTATAAGAWDDRLAAGRVPFRFTSVGDIACGSPPPGPARTASVSASATRSSEHRAFAGTPATPALRRTLSREFSFSRRSPRAVTGTYLGAVANERRHRTGRNVAS
jgi:hypothetical protein